MATTTQAGGLTAEHTLRRISICNGHDIVVGTLLEVVHYRHEDLEVPRTRLLIGFGTGERVELDVAMHSDVEILEPNELPTLPKQLSMVAPRQ